ncbi:TPA: nucleotidyl transferase AbiEii/AbiGii toxin family protein [Pseudomonas aeruginosa]
MPDFFELKESDQSEALEFASQNLGRPAFVLEKDIWVVWTLGKIFSAPIGEHLTFKGGTSLSKVYRLIDRFSEDIDLTYDIRQLLPGVGTEIPPSKGQANKWHKLVREKLPEWIGREVGVPAEFGKNRTLRFSGQS